MSQGAEKFQPPEVGFEPGPQDLKANTLPRRCKSRLLPQGSRSVLYTYPYYMFLEGQVDRQTDRRVHRRPTPKQYPSDFIGWKPVLSTGYLVSCLRTQRSASGEARTHNQSISGQALYHDCAPQLGSILCRYDTCPTQYAPDFRGSILCMQGTQYAPRESILCMEHFVALQCLLKVNEDLI